MMQSATCQPGIAKFLCCHHFVSIFPLNCLWLLNNTNIVYVLIVGVCQVRRQNKMYCCKSHHAICKICQSRNTCTNRVDHCNHCNQAGLYPSWCRSLQTPQCTRQTFSKQTSTECWGQCAVQLSTSILRRQGAYCFQRIHSVLSLKRTLRKRLQLLLSLFEVITRW